MKRIGLALSVVLLAATVITGTAPLAKAQTACPDYEFIAARGSGETSNITQLGMGALMFSTFQQLQAAAGTRRTHLRRKNRRTRRP